MLFLDDKLASSQDYALNLVLVAWVLNACPRALHDFISLADLTDDPSIRPNPRQVSLLTNMPGRDDHFKPLPFRGSDLEYGIMSWLGHAASRLRASGHEP